MPCHFAPAFADAGTVFDNGAIIAGGIPGGFFANNPILSPNLPAVRGSMPPDRTTTPGSFPANPGPDLCGPAVTSASAAYKLPAGLLNAIAVVESGRINPQTGGRRAWPWTIDANGTGYFYPNAPAAEQAAAGFEAAGITSLDIGCLQVNLAQHPDAFQNLAQAFDPVANANYAAMFLTGLKQKFGNWPQAVAAYHSQTPGLGSPYADRVYAQWQNTGAPPALPASTASGEMAALAPLPQTIFQTSSLLPPMPMMTRAIHGVTGRSLASYRAAPVAIATSVLPQG